MRTFLALVLLALLSGCHSLERLGRVSPLAGEVAEERINLWPLYYKNGQSVAVLWPIYDQDEQGFALRPLVTKDGSDWELLPPIGWWNTETKSWVFVPAYKFENSWGLFPVLGIGDFSYVGLAWWNKDDTDAVESYGLFPLFTIGPALNWVALAWWDKDDDGEVESYGLFPVATIGPALNWVALAWWDKDPDGKVESYGLFPLASKGERFGQVGPVVWGYDENGDRDFFMAFPLFGYGTLEDQREVGWAGPVWWVDDQEDEVESWGLFPLTTHLGRFHQVGPVFWGDDENDDTDYLVAFPLFWFDRREDGGGKLLSLLGGKGWDAEGKTEFLNVLGPVYHHTEFAEGESTHVLWPFVHWANTETERTWHVLPLFGHTTTKATPEAGPSSNTWGLLGLVETSRSEQLDSLRVAPLFSYVSADSDGQDFLDWISLVGYERHDDEKSSLHLGTPLVFNYHDDGEGKRWNALLKIFDYESDGTDSRFNLLYYLYRRETIGDETRRDMFPFITWDSGKEHARFSFLWRLIDYERNGDKTGGHLLFIPWGSRD